MKRKKRRLPIKQSLFSIASLLLAFFVVVLLNQAMGSQLPLPTAHDLLGGMLDRLYVNTNLSAAPPTDLEGDLLVHFLDVGQADCTLLQTPEQNILIDAGDLGGGAAIVDYLKGNGVKRLDMVIATHPHADHIGGMTEVIEAFDIGRVLFSPLPDSLIPTTKTYENLLDTIAKKGLKISRAKPDTAYDLGGGATMTILAPLAEYDDLNDTSISCRVAFGETSFLFTGDAEKISENDMVRRYGADLSSSVLKLGHHGSDTSSQEKWLNLVNPKMAIACVGYDNKYGHPDPTVLRRLSNRGTTLYRTDRNGAVVIASDGKHLSVSTEK